MSQLQLSILRVLKEDTEMCFFSRHIISELGATNAAATREIRQALKDLRVANYIELVRGLVSDEGPGYRGSGYRILPIGERYLKENAEQRQ